jgi:hypothetical protein
MTQVAVNGDLINKAVSLVEGSTAEDIVNAALLGWVDEKEHHKELYDLWCGENRPTLHWDPEFAGVGPDWRRPVC